jgi:hypothetical protein
MSDSDLRRLEADYRAAPSQDAAARLLHGMIRAGQATCREAVMAWRLVRLERAMWALLTAHNQPGLSHRQIPGHIEARKTIVGKRPSWEEDALSILCEPAKDTLEYGPGMFGTDPLDPDVDTRPPARAYGFDMSKAPETSSAEVLTLCGIIKHPSPRYRQGMLAEGACPICFTIPACEADCR